MSENTTRNRILTAAVLRFSQAAYEQVGLRNIAADSHVDVSYVHRCFGSKEALFLEALKLAAGDDILTRLDLADVAGSLVFEMFGRARSMREGDISSIDIILRSLASPKATGILVEHIPSGLISPLAKKLSDDDLVRASAMTAALVGFGVLRNLLPQFPSLDVRNEGVTKTLTRMIASISPSNSDEAQV